MELGTVLQIVEQRNFAGGVQTLAKPTREEWHDGAGELKTCLQRILRKVLIGIALQSTDGLIGTTQLHAEHLAATEEVAVLIGERGGGTQVASGVGAFGLET